MTFETGNKWKLLKHLIILAGNILYDPFHRTAEDPAQVIDGGGVYRLVLSQLIDGGAGNVMVLDQRVGGFPGRPECIPERLIRYHHRASFFRLRQS